MTGAGGALRGVEVGTRAVWAVLAALAAWLVWRHFRPAPIEREDLLPPVPPAGGAGAAPPPRQQAPAEGIVAGGLTTGVTAQLIVPAAGSRVYRGMFRSVFPAVVEVVNSLPSVQSVQIELVGDFFEYAGTSRLGVRTRLPRMSVLGGAVARLEVEVDSGNVNNVTFDFGQADAVFRVYVNGVQTQSTGFEVW